MADAARETPMARDDSAPPVSRPLLARDPALMTLTEIWLVSTVVTILGIRLYLEITNYPQVGGETLHIAHMLWGGLGMLVALGMVLLMKSAMWKPWAALVGGVGFGFFIDELGKFITADNDYFFQPTIGLIYALLVIFFLIARGIERFDTVRPGDRVLYAIGHVEQLASGRLDAEGRDEGLRQLDQSGIDSELTRTLRSILEDADLREQEDSPSWITRFRTSAMRRYWTLTDSRWLRRIVIAIFAIHVITFVGSISLAVAAGDFSIFDGVSFTEAGALISGFVAGALAAFGITMVASGKRLRGLRALANATLVTLLFGQFFAFATVQFAALGNLVLQLVILGVLRLWIAAEVRDRPEEDEFPV